MKKILIGIVVAIVALLALGGIYFYMAQPVASPSQNTNDAMSDAPKTTSAEQKVTKIDGSQSIVTYELNEELAGIPTHVVGNTNNISGYIVLDVNNADSTKKIWIDQIKINARTFKTDIAKRDENVMNLVLKSSDPANEFIIFKTTSIAGVPAQIESGVNFPIVITGDMTIMGITKPIIFTGTASITNGVIAKIKATTSVTYGDFGITIPNFDFLANVDKTVKLSVDIVTN